MSVSAWEAIAFLLFLLIFLLYLSRRAGRLDRLHHRVEVSRESLNTQLARRTTAARALSGSGLLDPVSALVIADAVEGAVLATEADDVTRSLAESQLSRALRASFEDPEVAAMMREVPGGSALLADLDNACTRVSMSRRFHNDAVGQTKLIRRRKMVRWFRLAGSAPIPTTFEMDDTPPVGLTA